MTRGYPYTRQKPWNSNLISWGLNSTFATADNCRFVPKSCINRDFDFWHIIIVVIIIIITTIIIIITLSHNFECLVSITSIFGDMYRFSISFLKKIYKEDFEYKLHLVESHVHQLGHLKSGL